MAVFVLGDGIVTDTVMSVVPLGRRIDQAARRGAATRTDKVWHATGDRVARNEGILALSLKHALCVNAERCNICCTARETVREVFRGVNGFGARSLIVLAHIAARK